ncbi:MAG TPA: XRE family transcriptional regulator [Mycobacteriales bacterium]|nr:XRE family transcriptional regulator [Mycobacteriales bacterium]
MMDATARQRIRAARTAGGLSLRELARRVGVSASQLSQIENGKSDPSVSTLYALVGELGLSLDALLEQKPAAAPAQPAATAPGRPAPGGPATPAPARPAGTGPIVRPGERRILHMDSGVVWERLTRGPSGVLDALLVTYEPGGASSSSGKLMTHGGTEFAFLIDGELTLQLGFETHLMRAGDSLEFAASTPHLYFNAGKVPAKGVWYVLDTQTVPTEEGLLRQMGTGGTGDGAAPSSAVDVLRAFSRD